MYSVWYFAFNPIRINDILAASDISLCMDMNVVNNQFLPFFLEVIGDVTDNAVEVEVVEGAGISEKVKRKQNIL